MNFVLDSSVTLAFVLEDESTPETEALLNSLGGGSKAFVPSLWRWEVGNALLTTTRRNRITAQVVQQHLAILGKLPIEVDETAWEESWGLSMAIASKHRLSLYDACYLEAALRLGLSLATLDGQLRTAAVSEGVSLLPK